MVPLFKLLYDLWNELQSVFRFYMSCLLPSLWWMNSSVCIFSTWKQPDSRYWPKTWWPLEVLQLICNEFSLRHIFSSETKFLLMLKLIYGSVLYVPRVIPKMNSMKVIKFFRRDSKLTINGYMSSIHMLPLSKDGHRKGHNFISLLFGSSVRIGSWKRSKMLICCVHFDLESRRGDLADGPWSGCSSWVPFKVTVDMDASECGWPLEDGYTLQILLIIWTLAWNRKIHAFSRLNIVK